MQTDFGTVEKSAGFTVRAKLNVDTLYTYTDLDQIIEKSLRDQLRGIIFGDSLTQASILRWEIMRSVSNSHLAEHLNAKLASIMQSMEERVDCLIDGKPVLTISKPNQFSMEGRPVADPGADASV